MLELSVRSALEQGFECASVDFVLLLEVKVAGKVDEVLLLVAIDAGTTSVAVMQVALSVDAVEATVTFDPWLRRVGAVGTASASWALSEEDGI